MSSRPAPSTQKPNKSHVALTQISSICVSVSLSLLVWAYKRALEPQYGTAPVLKHLWKIIWLGSILGNFVPTVSISPSPAILTLAMLLYTLPNSTYWVAAYTARLGDPQWGAVATHLLVLLPILSLGAAVVRSLQEAPYKGSAVAPMSGITLPVYASAITSLQGLWPSIPFISALPPTQICIQLGSACLILWVIAPFLPTIRPPSPALAPATAPVALVPKGKRRKTATQKHVTITPPPQSNPDESSGLGAWRIGSLLILPFASIIFRPPTLSQPLLEPWYHPSYPMRILSSVQSVYSGVVVVGESLSANPSQLGDIDYLRYLRAGHSLLGGVWVGPKAIALDPDLQLLDEAGEKVGDPIYSAFLVQEAALLVKKPEDEQPKNALMIGLGTGVSATSFMRHGIPTTIIEIDPAVYDAAKRFFGLPEPPSDTLFIQDAREWVHNRTRANGDAADAATEVMEISPDDQFDIVVHDCFSGGGIPAHLYTQEFWKELRKIVKSDAVVVVNFAGLLTSDSAKAVIMTLRSVFPQCRAFYDRLEPTENITTEFANWVLFCTPSHNTPLEFRPAVTSDFLGSHLRRHVLLNLPEREEDISTLGHDIPVDKREQFILKDARNPLIDWQQAEAMGHWNVIRSVLPDVFWETY